MNYLHLHEDHSMDGLYYKIRSTSSMGQCLDFVVATKKNRPCGLLIRTETILKASKLTFTYVHVLFTKKSNEPCDAY